MSDEAGQLVLGTQLSDGHHHPPPHHCGRLALLLPFAKRPMQMTSNTRWRHVVAMSHRRLCSDATNKLPAGSAFKEKSTRFTSPPGCTQVQGLSVSQIRLVRTEQSVVDVLSTGEFGQDADSPGTCEQPGGHADPQLSKALMHITRPCQSLA